MSATTQLGWLRNGEYAPIMLAEAKGYFKEEGIDHKIVDGGPGKNPIPIVAVGQAQFGIATNGMTVVTARLAKDPVDIVAIGTLFQQAPSSYIAVTAPDAAPTHDPLMNPFAAWRRGNTAAAIRARALAG